MIKFSMKKKILIFIFLPLLILFFFSGCKNFKKDKTTVKNLILITLDTTRADYIETSKDSKAKTPNIKNFSKFASVFENALTSIPITLPAHASILTGKYPHKVNVYNNGDHLKYSFTLQNILKKRGYFTAAVVSLGVLKKEFGTGDGFLFYDDNFKKGTFYRNAEDILNSARKLLNLKHKKFFYWFHFSDPHEPYAPPYLKKEFTILFNGEKITKGNLFEGIVFKKRLPLREGLNKIRVKLKKSKYDSYLQKYPVKITKFNFKSSTYILKSGFKKEKIKYGRAYIGEEDSIIFPSKKKSYIDLEFTLYPALKNDNTKRNFYRKEIEYMDKQIGKLFEIIKNKALMENTIIVIVGDHGEGLGEYKDHFGHIHYLRPQYIKVPLIYYSPLRKPSKIKKLVSIVDIFPTILSDLKIKTKIKLDGENLFSKSKRKYILSYTFRPESFFDGVSVIEDHFQFIMYKGVSNYTEFIDLKKETGFFPDNSTKKLSKYKNEIKKLKIIAKNKFKVRTKKRTLSEKSKRILKSLGYL